jgi:uncharacterized membrane protein YeaQ/YmgE (transglycosylase-associated protein family)
MQNHSNDEEIKSVRLLYDVARNHYEEVNAATSRLDVKANVIIGFIGILIGIGLNWVFGLYLNGQVPINCIGSYITAIVVLVVYFLLTSIHKAIKAFTPQGFRKLDSVKAINNYRDFQELDVMKFLAKDFAECATENSCVNDRKAKLIQESFNCFLNGIILFSVFIGLIIIVNRV